MSRGLGPALIDFSPLSQLGSTFFDAYDKAKLQAYQDQAAKIYDRSLSLAGLAPPAAAGAPVADAGNVPDVLGTPRMKPPSFADVGGSFGRAGAPLSGPSPDYIPRNTRSGAAMSMPVDPTLAPAIAKHAAAAGLDPVDVATAMSYETGGTFDPWKAGPTTKWGQHRGLIQWGQPQARQYGVTKETPVEEQVAAAIRYLRDRGVKPGMGLMDIYSAINAGSVGRNNASDAAAGGAPGTVADKVNNQMGAHRAKAQALLASVGAQAGAPLPPPRPAQLASADPNFVPAQSPAGPAASRPAQFLTAQAQNRAGISTAGTEGDPATPSDFVPGSTAVPAQPPQYGQPAPGAQPVGSTPTALSLLSQAQKDNLRAMLANPVTRQHAMQLIDKLNAPEEFEIKEAGGQFYRVGKRTGQAQVIPGIARPQEWTPHHAADGNDYLINKHTGQTKRLIEGSKFQDVTNPSELAALRPASYQGPVQRDKEGQIVYPGSGIHAADQRVDVTDPAELARVRPAGYTGPVQRGRNGELYFPGAGAAGINLQSAGDAASQTARIKQFEKLAAEGAEAQTKAVDIENLRDLGRNIGPQGAKAGFKEALGPIAQAAGVEIKDLADIQAYQSIVKRLTPQMREPGAGSSSNLDVQMFEKALPGLLMHPDGREMVLDVMKAGNDYTAEKAAIAQAALLTESLPGGISHAEAARRMQALPNPLDRFREFRKNNPTVIRDALQAKAPAAGGEASSNLPRIPANATPQQVKERFKSGTRVILPDGSPGVVP